MTPARMLHQEGNRQPATIMNECLENVCQQESSLQPLGWRLLSWNGPNHSPTGIEPRRCRAFCPV